MSGAEILRSCFIEVLLGRALYNTTWAAVRTAKDIKEDGLIAAVVHDSHVSSAMCRSGNDRRQCLPHLDAVTPCHYN
jgi:hypothetical protein